MSADPAPETIALTDYTDLIKPGPGASGDWLRAMPERLILGLAYLDATACRPDAQGRDAALFLAEIVLALLRAERGEYVVRFETMGEGVKFSQWIGAAAKTEFWRREGQIVVKPPLVSIFAPGDSKVYPVDVAEA